MATNELPTKPDQDTLDNLEFYCRLKAYDILKDARAVARTATLAEKKERARRMTVHSMLADSLAEFRKLDKKDAAG
mgnify:CR=1 FL=1